MEVEDFNGLEGLDEYRELLKTPKQLRIERGIDPNLISQKRDLERERGRKRKQQLQQMARQPLRKQAAEELRKMKDQGYSLEQISAKLIVPQCGKGRKAKKKFKDALAQKLKGKKAGQPGPSDPSDPSAPSAPPANDEVSFRIPLAELRFFSKSSEPNPRDLRCKLYYGGVSVRGSNRSLLRQCISELEFRLKMH